MSIHLYKHNEDAYRAVETMLEEKQMAAVIHPTGTGKSMIAFKLVEQHPHKHFLWLSPSEYIYKTQLENIDTQFSNIEYMSYSRLMKHEDSIDTLHPDYIILDEFHRCGAAEWGKSVRKLLEAYPKAKRLGLSATNIRYLDNQRNMAEELFEGNIASEMTLGEAIVREILPEPKYVIAMYSYKKELEQLKKRIEGLSNPGLVSENEKLLEQLKRALEQADGLTEVFARQMTKPDGKYIVFCSGREHMDEMKAQAGDWFSKVDKKPHIYTAYYNEASTSKAFAEFKKDTGSHLKLLYCIDMLNEGIHVDDVDGVILLRPTVSPIIYLQQIGRALSAGNKNQPVIFDLVNNFDSLYCIDCLKNEMQEAFLLYPDTHSPREHFDDRFRIIDETKDSREIFMRLQENLGSAWDTYYEAAKQWYEENGNLKIPKSYVTESGLTLGAWINTQRRVKSGNISGNLTWEKIQKLNDIGMIWDVTDSSWQEVIEELKCYRNTYGNLDIKAKYVSPTGFRLGSWINNMRFKVKKYGIRNWYRDVCTKEIEDVNVALDAMQQEYDAVFPDQAYEEAVFKHYPIILRSFDMTSEEVMQDFVLRTIAFAETSFDYMLVLQCDENGAILQHAIKFPKRFFKAIQEALVSGEEITDTSLLTPYPIDVTENMLECFSGDWKIKRQTDNPYVHYLGDIAEELWVYSKLRELLCTEEDREYCICELKKVAEKIAIMKKEIHLHLDEEVADQIDEMCNHVYEGNCFDNIRLNEFVQNLQYIVV